MHFFRIKIKRHRTQRRPSLTNNEQEASPAISGRNIREPSPTISTQRLRDSIWRLLPFRSKVSNKYKRLVNE